MQSASPALMLVTLLAAATAMAVIKLLGSPNGKCALAGGALLCDLLKKTSYLARATKEQLQLASRLLNPRLRCIELLHHLSA